MKTFICTFSSYNSLIYNLEPDIKFKAHLDDLVKWAWKKKEWNLRERERYKVIHLEVK